MAQTIKERLELLKRDQNAKKEDDPHFTGCGGCGEQYPAICGCRDFNAGVDACLPLLEEVRKEVIELVKTNVPYVTGDQERLIQEIDNLLSNTQ